MLQPQCLRCGASAQAPLCAKCIEYLVEHRPLLFDPRLEPGPSSVDLLTQSKRLVVGPDPKKPLVAFDDKTWDWKTEEGAASILKHMGFNGGQPSFLSFGDSEVLHDILFRYSHKPPDSLELASRLESLCMRVEAIPYLLKQPPMQEVKPGTQEPQMAPETEPLPEPPSLENPPDEPGSPPPAPPDEPEPEEPEPWKKPEPGVPRPIPPPPPIDASPPVPERPPHHAQSRQTPPPPEAVAAAKELEQLNAEIQRLSMIKTQMERQKDQIQNMLQVERQALEEREVLVTAQAATLQSRQKELENREKDVAEKEADMRRLQRRLDLTELLASVPGLDRRDVNQIRAAYQDMDSLKASPIEDIIGLAKLEEVKARSIYAALHPNWAEEDLVQRAHSLLEAGDFHGALGCYDAMLKKNPENETLWFNKAEVLGMLGDKEGALQAYSRVLDLNKRNVVAWREKANLLFESSRLEEGIRALRNLMELDREHADIVLTRADELVANRKETDAVLLYNAILETDPGNVRAYMGLGDCMVALGDSDMADKMYTRALGRDPQNPKALYRKGSMLNRRGRWGAALQLFNRAIALDWNYAAPWVGKGDILLKQGKHSEALDCFNKATEFDSKWADGWAGKARAHLMRGETAEAENARQNALKLDKKGEAVAEMEKVFERGSEDLRPGVRKVLIKDDSTDVFSKVIKGTKSIDESHVARRLADVALERDDLEEALKGYEEAIRLNPGDVNAWCGKGLVLRKLGRMPDAWKAYDRALKLDPSREDAKRGRDACSKEDGKR